MSFTGAFHGRTLGALSVTPKRAIQEPFGPLLDAVTCPFNDEAAVRGAVDESVAAVLLEPIQGEAGVVPASDAFMRAAREACDRAGALLIVDEVQCGIGRTGHWWGHRGTVRADIMTLAKPLAGGLPAGATLVSDAVAERIHPGDHGSTFAGSPLVSAAALAVLDEVERLLPGVEALGERLRALLSERLPARVVDKVRGRGLLVGVRFVDGVSSGDAVSAALRHGLLLANAGDNTARFIPPLNVTEAELVEAVDRAAAAFSSLPVAGAASK